jgi:phage terminase small subunit
VTPKQQRFVDEYLVDLNATQAAIRAGYSAATAEAAGSRLLRNVKVAAAIAGARTDLSERTKVTQDRVLEELARIAFSDMRTFTSWGPDGVTLLDSDGLDEDDARCVAEVKQTTTQHGGSLGFKLHDKVGALEKIGRHLGMFVDLHADVSKLTPQERESKVADIESRARSRMKVVA